jgi:hypothetical protein
MTPPRNVTKQRVVYGLLSLSWLFLVGNPAAAQIVINEIMYHPPGEDVLQLTENRQAEFLELQNTGAVAIDVSGWRLDRGVDYTLPAGTRIEAGGYLVVAADVETFSAKYPGVANVVGDWSGRLSNSGETIGLENAAGVRVDLVDYSDDGEWARRERGPEDFGHEGWIWSMAHDGGGRSLELINASVTNQSGQNWAASEIVGGTPGAVNTVRSSDTGALVLDVAHSPAIPTAADAVTVRARLIGGSPAAAALFWRIDGAGDFTQVEMTGTGDQFQGTIPPQADRTVVEFYLVATDATGSRIYPAPALPSNEPLTNLLYQVEDDFNRQTEWDPAAHPVYRIVMTAAERDELLRIGTTRSEAESNAQMNATFISIDGTGARVRYNLGVRNRGASSRVGPPNNYFVNFRNDEQWDGLSGVKLNSRNPHSQVLGALLFWRAGIATARTIPVRVRINGNDLSDGNARMFGAYARVEPLDGGYPSNHFPSDPDGNLYQIRDDDDRDFGNLRYEGEDPDAYRNTYFKQTNQEEDDWNDLIKLTDTLENAPDDGYAEALGEVLDLDQWLRMIAVDALLGNREGGLNSAKGDDFLVYRGVADPRFQLLPHDLDSVMGFDRPAPDRDIFVYAGLKGLTRLLNHPDIVPRYYAFLDLLDSFYTAEVLDPLIDQALGGWVSDEVVSQVKQFAVARRAGILRQIPQAFSVSTNLADGAGFPETQSGLVELSGDYPPGEARSVIVNGIPAELDPRNGKWRLDTEGSALSLNPGVNRVTVTSYAGENGTGEVVHRDFADVLNSSRPVNPVSGTLGADDPLTELELTVRDTYLPGVPVLVRVEARRPGGSFTTDSWDATARLSADRLNVRLSPDTVSLRNGLGSALVMITDVDDAGTGEELTLIPAGSVWRYLDDGSDQGSAWRGGEFDDGAWESGAAELGYGDRDEATTISFGGNEDEKFATTYFRSEFELVEDPATFAEVTVRLKYDDGAIVYINGVEVVVTENVVSGIRFDQYTDDVGGGDTSDEDAFFEFDVPPAVLESGFNTVAVEIHQGDPDSSDVSLDLELSAAMASEAAIDPGDFVLSASVAGQLKEAPMGSLANEPVTPVSGTLEGAETTWEGIVRVTGDVIVPDSHLLTISPGTLVLFDGTSTPLDENGADLVVRGGVSVRGSASEIITFTASAPDAPWGEIRFEDARPAEFTYTNITRAGHSPKTGHTNKGPALRLIGSSVSFDHCNITDIAGKLGRTDDSEASDSELVFRNCHLGRAVMGPELFDTALLMEDTWVTDMRGIYREDGITDDDDGIYLHEAGPGQEMIIRRSVFAYCDDDGIDLLGGETTVEDVILRNIECKGVSVLSNAFTMRRGLVVDCDIGLSAKGQGSDRVPVTIEQSTIIGNSIAVQAENKDGDDPNVTVIYDISNSILSAPDGIRTDYDPADILVRYSLLSEDWPGSDNDTAAPLFVDAPSHAYHLRSGSPAIDAGDPAAPLDADGTRADIGRFAFSDGAENLPDGLVIWRAAEGPFHLTGDVTVPRNIRLLIEPGASIYVDRNRKLTVRGTLGAEGSANARIRFTSVPGAEPVPDPAGNGELGLASPKWAGIEFVNSMSPDNVLSYIDIENAQAATGSVGIDRSEVLIDHCTFKGSHLRMIFAQNSSATIQHCMFPDMFAEDESPAALRLDNISEHIKVTGKFPADGHFIIQDNEFGTNKGHNDVIDADSGLWPNEPILQIRRNVFAGAGDELVDLGGDVYVEGNFFHNVFKDDETSDRGYANAISMGDLPADRTVVAARNIFWDVDHAVSLKRNSATIFEHNTVYKVHGDFTDRFDHENIGSVVSLFADETPGGGAFLMGNLMMDLPRVFGNIDQPGNRLSVLGFFANFVDRNIGDVRVGERERTIESIGLGNRFGDEMFRDAENGDFRLAAGSLARSGTLFFGQDFGAFVSPGAWIAGEPRAVTASTTASLFIGGPGIFAYRYRINDGDWSEPIAIGSGFDPEGTMRWDRLILEGLTDGAYSVSVIGQDFAGVWQSEEEPAISNSWRVDTSLRRVVLSEILAANRSNPFAGIVANMIEVANHGAAEVDLGGMALSDRDDQPGKFVFPAGTILAPGGHAVVTTDGIDAGNGLSTGFSLNANAGETVYLFDDTGAVIDSVSFGFQAADYSISRLGHAGDWGLSNVTPGAKNTPATLGDPRDLVINEWLTDGVVRYASDWVELFNTSGLPVALGGLEMADRMVAPDTVHTFAPLTFMEPGGYRKLIADSASADGANHLSFSLDATQEAIVLSDPGNPGDPIDLVFYGSQTTDVSEARGPDGSGERMFSTLPTAGLANTGTPGTENALALIDGLRITEIMFAPIGGSDFEFLEFRNVGSAFLQLGGVRITAGVAFVFPDKILAPGEEIVVVAHLPSFEARYGSGLPVAGAYSGKLANEGEEIVVLLPEPFDAAILRFAYNDAWEPAADGGGFSLTLADPSLHPREFGGASSWIASDVAGGTPAAVGQTGGSPFFAWLSGFGLNNPVGDRDQDGLPQIVEYALGLDPLVPTSAGGASSLPSPSLAPDGRLEFRFRLPVDSDDPGTYGAVDLNYTVETSRSLKEWTPVAARSGRGEWSSSDGEEVGVSEAVGGFREVTVRLVVRPEEAVYVRLALGLIRQVE